MTHFHSNFVCQMFFFYTLLTFNLFQNLKDGFYQIIGVHQNMISDKKGGGVSQFLIFSDKGGRGSKLISVFFG